MMAKTPFPALGLLLIFACLPSSARAQSDDWEFVVAPYVLFGSLTGEAAIGRSGATPVDLSFSDLVENLEIGAMLHAEVWKGAWGIMADVVFMQLGADVALGETTVLDIQVEELIAEAFVGRRFDGPGRRVDIFAGARFWDLDLDLDLGISPGLAVERGDSWVDPVVGGRLLQDLSEDWFLTARGDIGGLGGATFSWNAQGGIGWEVSGTFSLVAQYKALGVDFENDEVGTSDFLSYVTTMHGPLLGFVFRF